MTERKRISLEDKMWGVLVFAILLTLVNAGIMAKLSKWVKQYDDLAAKVTDQRQMAITARDKAIDATNDLDNLAEQVTDKLEALEGQANTSTYRVTELEKRMDTVQSQADQLELDALNLDDIDLENDNTILTVDTTGRIILDGRFLSLAGLPLIGPASVAVGEALSRYTVTTEAPQPGGFFSLSDCVKTTSMAPSKTAGWSDVGTNLSLSEDRYPEFGGIGVWGQRHFPTYPPFH